MKKNIIIALFISIFILTMLITLLPKETVLKKYDNKNIVLNPGFEESVAESLYMWNINENIMDNHVKVEIENNNVYGGRQCIKITNEDLSYPIFNQELLLDKNSIYEISAMACLLKINGNGYGANIGNNQYNIFSHAITSVNGKWEKVNFYVKTATEKKYFKIVLGIGTKDSKSSGIVLFDDIAVKKVSPDDISDDSKLYKLYDEKVESEKYSKINKFNQLLYASLLLLICCFVFCFIIYLINKKNIFFKILNYNKIVSLIIIYILGIAARIYFLQLKSPANNDSNIVINMIIYVIEIIFSTIIYYLSQKIDNNNKNIVIVALIIFNPALIFTVSAYKFFDIIFAVLLLIIFYMVYFNHYKLSIVISVIASFMIPFGFFVVIIPFAKAFVSKKKNVIFLLLMYILLCIPAVYIYFVKYGMDNLLYLISFSGFASNNGYNIFFLLGLNNKYVDTKFLILQVRYISLIIAVIILIKAILIIKKGLLVGDKYNLYRLLLYMLTALTLFCANTKETSYIIIIMLITLLLVSSHWKEAMIFYIGYTVIEIINLFLIYWNKYVLINNVLNSYDDLNTFMPVFGIVIYILNYITYINKQSLDIKRIKI